MDHTLLNYVPKGTGDCSRIVVGDARATVRGIELRDEFDVLILDGSNERVIPLSDLVRDANYRYCSQLGSEIRGKRYEFRYARDGRKAKTFEVLGGDLFELGLFERRLERSATLPRRGLRL